MVTKKDLIIAVLATFCLTATIFMVIPIRSSTNPYDPWLDVNDDGKINMRDIAQEILAFGTTGDTTKNVYVTNWPASAYRSIPISTGPYNIIWSNYTADFGIPPYGIFCDGYSTMFLHMCLIELSYTGPGTTTIYISDIVWNSSAINVGEDHFTPELCNITVDHWPQYGVLGPQTAIMKIEIKAENIEVLRLRLFSSIPSGRAYMYFLAYLRNE